MSNSVPFSAQLGNKSPLLIKFFSYTQPRPSENSKGERGPRSEAEQGKEQQDMKIDTFLLDSRFHFLKDIQSHFPQVQFKEILLCPKLIEGSPKLIEAEEWRHLKSDSKPTSQHWFAIFEHQKDKKKYSEYPLQLIAIILHHESNFYCFLGYVPTHYFLLDIIRSLSSLFDIELNSNSVFASQFSNEDQSVSLLQQTTVGEVPGCYIKVKSCGSQTILPIGEELEDLVDQNQLFMAMNQAALHMQNIQTNLAMESQLWNSNTDIETCIELKKDRQKLISVKDNEELNKMRSRVRMAIEKPYIELFTIPEEEMEEKLKLISEEIEKFVDFKQ